MSRRRILLTTDVVGGVWDFCLTLAEGLRATRHEVVLLALGSPDLHQRQMANQVGAQLITLPLKLEWMRDAEADVELTPALVEQVARQVGADVVHANQFAAACANVDVPLVLTVHSDVLSWRRWTLGDSSVPAEWQSYVGLVQSAIATADRVVAVSRFLADEVKDLYAVSRTIDVIHNGWPGPTPLPAARERATVVAGRIWDSAKNIPLVAEAAIGWSPGNVYLAGENVHPDGGEAVVPEPLQAMGFLRQEALQALLGRCRVYLSPARYDPFGLLPLQAALRGCKLLLSDIPSYREVWGDAAAYFRPDDADDLRQQWQRLLLDTSDSRAYVRARSQLTAERMVSGYDRLYAGAGEVVAA